MYIWISDLQVKVKKLYIRYGQIHCVTPDVKYSRVGGFHQ
jgi:hypothetical protein